MILSHKDVGTVPNMWVLISAHLSNRHLPLPSLAPTYALICDHSLQFLAWFLSETRVACCLKLVITWVEPRWKSWEVVINVCYKSCLVYLYPETSSTFWFSNFLWNWDTWEFWYWLGKIIRKNTVFLWLSACWMQHWYWVQDLASFYHTILQCSEIICLLF